MLNNFSDFCDILLKSGFSLGGGNAKGIYSIVPYSWEQQEQIDSPVKWHTGNPETDPWEWRMRVLDERDDIAYAKLFFGASGFITKEWYPLFYAVRRRGWLFEESYESGTVSGMAKKIYDIIEENGEVPYHELKRLGGFGREDSGAFARAVLELQMGMFITMCGRAQRTNMRGESYGWNSTVFVTSELFWEKRGFVVPDLNPEESFEKIRERVLLLNPFAKEKNIGKFIRG